RSTGRAVFLFGISGESRRGDLARQGQWLDRLGREDSRESHRRRPALGTFENDLAAQRMGASAQRSLGPTAFHRRIALQHGWRLRASRRAQGRRRRSRRDLPARRSARGRSLSGGWRGTGVEGLVAPGDGGDFWKSVRRGGGGGAGLEA